MKNEKKPRTFRMSDEEYRETKSNIMKMKIAGLVDSDEDYFHIVNELVKEKIQNE